ncbi:MAG: MFS transporter [Minwuia sp.]|nr:MFS transporter [Minwuia sp.]
MTDFAAAPERMGFLNRDRVGFFFLNVGHFFDHMFMLIFATVAVALAGQDGMSYRQLLELLTPALVMFGVGSLPAGWLADRWSRQGMIAVFFIGIGASSIATGLADETWQIMLGLGAIGTFAAIYHPVGIAMVVEGQEKVGRALGINGVWGNMGLAAAPLLTGWLIEVSSWRAAFIVPGIVAVLVGCAYVMFCRNGRNVVRAEKRTVPDPSDHDLTRPVLIRVALALTLTILFGGVVFHASAVVLPKLFSERLADITSDIGTIGTYAAIVLAIASFAQIVVGHLLDRFPARRILFLIALLQVPVLAFVATISGIPIVLASILMMALIFGEIPIHDTILTRYTRSAWRGRVFAVKFVLALLVAAVVPRLIGSVHDGYGLDVLFLILAAAAAGVALSALILPIARKVA